MTPQALKALNTARRIVFVAIPALFIILLPSLLPATEIQLRSGKTFVGEIAEENKNFFILSVNGTKLSIAKAVVVRIDGKPYPDQQPDATQSQQPTLTPSLQPLPTADSTKVPTTTRQKEPTPNSPEISGQNAIPAPSQSSTLLYVADLEENSVPKPAPKPRVADTPPLTKSPLPHVQANPAPKADALPKDTAKGDIPPESSREVALPVSGPARPPVTTLPMPTPERQIPSRNGHVRADSLRVQRLIADLRSPHITTRTRAVDSLANTEIFPSSAFNLVALLADSTPMSPFTDSAQNATIGKWSYQRIKTIGKPAIPALIAGLSHPSALIRSRCAQILGELKASESTVHLILLLEDASADVVTEASRALQECGDLASMHAALPKHSNRIRSEVIDILSKIPDSSSVTPLLPLLRDKDPVIREKVALALGNLNDRRVVQPLVLALRDPFSRVRASAATALGALRDTTALRPLMEAGKDENPLVRQKTAEAIREISSLVVRWRDALIEKLILNLRSELPEVREKAKQELWLLTGESLGDEYQAWWQWWESRARKLR